MMAAQTDWTGERIQRLRTLWAEGHSTEEIGRRMGTTKNAIVGKAHRLNLPARPSPIRRRGPQQAKIPRQGRRPSLPPLPIPVVSTPPARSLVAAAERRLPAREPLPPPIAEKVRQAPPLAREGHSKMTAVCCWPIGEPGRANFRFCGDPVMAPNRPYCEEHCDLAYIKKTVRRRDFEEDAHALS